MNIKSFIVSDSKLVKNFQETPQPISQQCELIRVKSLGQLLCGLERKAWHDGFPLPESYGYRADGQ